MTAVRPRPFTQGATSERLAQYILGNMSFVTPVPYPEDIGHDFHCVLHVAVEGDNRLVHSGPAFTVQVKSRRDNLVYRSDYERKWIGEQADSFFVCVANRTMLNCDIYSTWNVLNGVLMHGTGMHPGQDDSPSKTKKIVLKFGALKNDDRAAAAADGHARHPYGGCSMSADGTLTIPLGPPVLSLKPHDVNETESAKTWANLLREWIELDRANITRVLNGMYWVYGPKHWETNRPAWSGGQLHSIIYSNRDNFRPDEQNLHRPTVVENFVQTAEALNRVLKRFDPRERPLTSEQTAALEIVLKLYGPYKGTMAGRLLAARGQADQAT
jgi:hypothetical protein